MTFLHKNKSMNKNWIFRIKANQEGHAAPSTFNGDEDLLFSWSPIIAVKKRMTAHTGSCGTSQIGLMNQISG